VLFRSYNGKVLIVNELPNKAIELTICTNALDEFGQLRLSIHPLPCIVIPKERRNLVAALLTTEKDSPIREEPGQA
jgi:hypothetical protein